MADGWDLVQEDYGEREIMSRVPRDSFKGISIIPRKAPGQVIQASALSVRPGLLPERMLQAAIIFLCALPLLDETLPLFSDALQIADAQNSQHNSRAQ